MGKHGYEDKTPKRFTNRALTGKLPFARWDGGEAFNDFMGHLGNMGDLKQDKGMGETIAELESLIHGQRMESNSMDKPKIQGSLAGRIAKTLIYGKERKSETDLEIGKIKVALIDFAKQARNENQRKEKQYIKKARNKFKRK